MKFTLCASLAFTLSSLVSCGVLQKRASNSWAGGNLYFLHGLSDSDQDYYINTMASKPAGAADGAKVVRLWVTGTSYCQKGSSIPTPINDLEPNTIGTFDDGVLAALDGVLAKLAAKGMKAIISPHDGNQFGVNGCDVYGKASSPNNECPTTDPDHTAANTFYSSSDLQTKYDARIAHILNYQSPSAAKPWKSWSSAILAFDIQNEPFQQAEGKAASNDPDTWLCTRAQKMQSLIASSGVKVSTGGIGGSATNNNNMMPAALACASIDMVAVHAYPDTASYWTSTLPSYLSTAESAEKLLYVEEWGVKTSSIDDFDTQAAALTGTGVPWVYWQFVPGPDATPQGCQGQCCGKEGYDGLEVGLTSSKGDAKGAVEAAGGKAAGQDWTGLVG